MRTLRIAMAQINTTVGDLEGNTKKILQYIEQARNLGVDLITFPELAITGYPPEDLLLMPQFVNENLDYLKEIIKATSGICVIVGFVDKKDDLYNAAAIINNGTLAGVYHKIYLPNYGVFDENRYFQGGNEIPVFNLGETAIGLNICEDMWYPEGPTTTQTLKGGAELIVNISASPYHAEKGNSRKRMLATRAADNIVIVAFNNLVGGQDELIFDGGSMILDQKGDLLCQGKQFEEDFIVTDLNLDAVFLQRIHDPRRRKDKFAPSDHEDNLKKIDLKMAKTQKKPALPKRDIEDVSRLEEVYRALVLGVSDYVKKNGFKKVALGLSGGIDSSLAAAIAADALGRENVIGVAMPSPYTSSESQEDAENLASNFKIKFKSIPIVDAIKAYERMLSSEFQGLTPDVTEENLQARIRANILMALSNKFGWLVLTTGNKSESSVGYCTLYGDMAGGFGVIKDVPKTLVYELARYRNSIEETEVIPRRVLIKPPSAELRPEQKDTDSLPPYSILDPILQAYVEEDKSLEEILGMGFEEEIVKEVIRLVNRNEYKRRQSPPGIKITPRGLGKDRRLPISNKYRVR
ncbi:MAG: NAD+ synthase [Proteobacteria bacterium]|nr:NAD+ synthase [Pseudomonadota bacterium]